MTTAEMVAAFSLVIEYGIDNPTADQIVAHKRHLRKERLAKEKESRR